MAEKMIRVAIDAMGGDHFPDVLVEGSIAALGRYPDVEVLLVGDERIVGESVARHFASAPGEKPGGAGRLRERLRVVHAAEVIAMDESPGRAVRAKKDSSIVVCNKLCHAGEADAVIAAGSTGAAMAASLLYMGRLKGVSRPAIMAFFPSKKNTVAILDVGANTDCKPAHLYQFGVMGAIFVANILGYENPRVGLLSIGEERSKGNEMTTEAYELLENSGLRFIGNIEGRDIFNGVADVVVCDGFVGNVLLKFGESVFGFVTHQLKEKISRSIPRKLGGLLLRPAMKEIKEDMSPEDYGGAPLVGVDGISIICHGNSSAVAIANAIKVARHLVSEEVNQKIKNEFTRNNILGND